jgi:hypothetical protein
VNPKKHKEKAYTPMLSKTFDNVLNNWLAAEFPHLGGPKVRALFVQEVLRLIDTYATPAQRLQPGQVVWYAVDQTDKPHDRQCMAQTRLVPVVLTLVDQDDIRQLSQGVLLPEVRRGVIIRLLHQADAQGGVLAETDLALLLSGNIKVVSEAILSYEQTEQCTLPRRGTVHDLGPSVTHKGIIARKAYLEAKQAPQVAWETSHSLKSTERYLVDLMRIYISLKRHGLNVSETAFATGLSISLVKEYAALIEELGLNDSEMARILTILAKTSATTLAENDHPDAPTSSCPEAGSQPSPAIPSDEVGSRALLPETERCL